MFYIYTPVYNFQLSPIFYLPLHTSTHLACIVSIGLIFLWGSFVFFPPYENILFLNYSSRHKEGVDKVLCRIEKSMTIKNEMGWMISIWKNPIFYGIKDSKIGQLELFFPYPQILLLAHPAHSQLPFSREWNRTLKYLPLSSQYCNDIWSYKIQ